MYLLASLISSILLHYVLLIVIIDVKEYVVFLARVVNYKQFEESLRPFASPSAKWTDNAVIMPIVSPARKFEWLYIFWNVSYICFSNYKSYIVFSHLKIFFGGVLTTSRLFRSLSNSRFNGNICGDKT